jgi:peptidoglycan/xylan/chitin deacetylase (PgdA/CDA1 family)
LRPLLWVLPIAAAAAVAWAAAFQRALPLQAREPATLAWACSASGETGVFRPGAKRWSAVAGDASLVAGAKLRVGDQGSAVLSTPGLSARLHPRTRVLLADDSLILLHGTVDLECEERPDPIPVRSPQGMVCLRGGQVRLRHEPARGTTVTVLSGLAEAESHGRTVTLGHGGTARLPLGTPEDRVPSELLCGHDRDVERRLGRQLLDCPLRQELVSIGVAGTPAFQGAEVALHLTSLDMGAPGQALSDAQEDAWQVIGAAFDALPDLGEVDVTSVIPSREARFGRWRPVFSVAARREDYARATKAPLPQALARLGRLRYDRRLLRDGAALPASAVTWRAPELERPAGTMASLPAEGDAAAPSGRRSSPLAVPTTRRALCLTFDDGPRPLMTAVILAALREARVRGTFFLVGRECLQYPELVCRIAAEGHELGNHSFSHDTVALRDPERAVWEARATDDLIYRLTGRHTRFYRPPGGHSNRAVLQGLEAAGFTPTFWTCNTGDWAGGPPERIATAALEGAEPGAVILLHEGQLNTVRALPAIAAGLRARNLEPLTLSEACALPVAPPPRDLELFALLLGVPVPPQYR